MIHWFIFKGKNSYSDFGLWISKLPKITKASERYEEVSVPGRAGSLILLEGEDVYDSYQKECVVTIPNDRNIEPILEWLRGSGELSFSNELGYVYDAIIAAQVSFERISNSIQQAKIPFYVKPFKKHTNASADSVTITGASGTIYNPGDVASKPKVSITGSGSNAITIAGQTMTFSSLSGTVIVDCDAEFITKSGLLWTESVDGEFWKIPTGQSTITQTGSMEIEIFPEWRWV